MSICVSNLYTHYPSFLIPSNGSSETPVDLLSHILICTCGFNSASCRSGTSLEVGKSTKRLFVNGRAQRGSFPETAPVEPDPTPANARFTRRREMKRFQSILCASLLTVALSSAAFAGSITTSAGSITTSAGSITTSAGSITTSAGSITTSNGSITTRDGSITTIAGYLYIIFATVSGQNG